MIELTIHHADCQKCKVIENRIKDKENDFENEKRKAEAIEKSVSLIFQRIKQALNYSTSETNCESLLLMNENFLSYTHKNFKSQTEWRRSICPIEVIEIIKSLCEKAGYKVSFTKYSTSWQNRSGKYGNLYISW